MRKHKILCVDDEIDNVDALERLFRKKYEVIKQTSGFEAIKWLDQNPDELALIISDQRMPEMSGVEFLEQTLKSHPDTIRILLTGYTDIESVISAVNQGQIYRYLTKPWDPQDLMLTVDRAVERFVLNQELKKKNQELANALYELKSLDQAKSHFMILINHELKTPLTSILNFGSLLTETDLDDSQKKYLNRMMVNAERLKNLVEDVLLIMKSETQQLKIEIQNCNLKSILDHVEFSLKPLLSAKQQTIKYELEVDSCSANETLLSQIFLRLIQNANRFGNPGSHISVKTYLFKENMNQKLRIEIFNEGPQIPSSVLNKIFKPFFIDENIMNHTTGTGLGLTVCQSLLKLLDSETEVINESHGVRICFNLKTA